ncbi:transmembrane protein 242-like [Ptychodera flava]|uniref:transmembrane protein 242-like n=1 Tax=Ptychodera flava TaxID=63121 RepID=UPI00396A81AA
MAANVNAGDGDSLQLEQRETKDAVKMKSKGNEKETLVKGTLLLSGIAGAAMIFGFGATLGMAKRKNPAMFSKGFLPIPSAEMPESGASLGLRALAWGTVFSITGVGALTFAVCKALGIESLSDFKNTMQSTMPKVKRNEDALKEISWQDLMRKKIQNDEDSPQVNSDINHHTDNEINR